MKKLVFFTLALGLSPLGHTKSDSGCGPGSLIVSRNSKLMQLIALSTNNTSVVTQASAITSGTSNCKTDGFVMNDRQQEYFVAHHLDQILTEAAANQGEHLEAVALLSGCQDTKAISQALVINLEAISGSRESSNQALKVIREASINHCGSLV